MPIAANPTKKEPPRDRWPVVVGTTFALKKKATRRSKHLPGKNSANLVHVWMVKCDSTAQFVRFADVSDKNSSGRWPVVALSSVWRCVS